MSGSFPHSNGTVTTAGVRSWLLPLATLLNDLGISFSLSGLDAPVPQASALPPASSMTTRLLDLASI